MELHEGTYHAMKRLIRLALATCMGVGAIVLPSIAGTLAKGTPAKGVYWAEEKGMLGKIYYECFDAKTNKKVNKERCVDAGAIKPEVSPK